MLNAYLTRCASGNEGTFGSFIVPDLALSFLSLECPAYKNRKDLDAIPPGAYTCALAYSSRMGKEHYLLHGVPNRSGIFIHAANFAGDAQQGFRSELRGCIALGLGFIVRKTTTSFSQASIFSSRDAINQLETALAGQPFLLEVRHPFLTAKIR